MTTKEAANYLGISYYYLRNLRHMLHQHDGPKYIKLPRKGKQRGGMACFYTKEALDLWKSTNKWRKRPL